MAVCANCGAEFPEAAHFCPACATPVTGCLSRRRIIRAVRSHLPPLIALAALALAAIITAWFSGARFVGTSTNGASLAMAIATAVAILAYILILFLVATPAARLEARREGA